MSSNNRYTYRAEWSAEDGEYVGLVAEFPSLSWLAPTAGEATIGIEQLVADVIDDMTKTGEPIPVPLSERRYSGNISFRTSPDHHRRLAIEAAEQGVSINQWMVQRLSVLRDHQPTTASSLANEVRKVIDEEIERLQVTAKEAGRRAAIQGRPGYANVTVGPTSKGFLVNGVMSGGLADKSGTPQEWPAEEFAMWAIGSRAKVSPK